MAHLTSIADIKKTEIENWIDNQIKKTKDHANNNILIEYSDHNLPKEGSLTEEEQTIEDNLSSLLVYYKENYSYDEIYFTDITGRVLASSDKDYVGTKIRSPILSEIVETEEISILDIHKTMDDKYVMHFGYPVIKREHNHNSSNVIGVLLLKIDMEKTLYPIIRSWPGMGGTGETLLSRIDGDNILFINQLRHSPNKPLTLTIPIDSELAKPARFAIMGESATVKALDYRGIEVVSAYRNIPKMNWGFVAKIDQTEAFASVNILFNRIIVSATALLFFAIFLGSYASNMFTKRIILLEESTSAIAEGEYMRIPEDDSSDEIGRLVTAFNEMMEKLQENIETEKQLTKSLVEIKAQEEYQYNLTTLYRYSLDLYDLSDIDKISETTLQILYNLFGEGYYTFFIVDGDELVHTKPFPEPLMNNIPINGQGLVAKSVKEKRPVLVNDVRNDPDYIMGDKKTMSELAVPIIVGSEVYGVINLESKKLDAFTENELNLSELLALQVSSTITRIRSYETRDRIYEQLLEERLKTEQALEMERLKTNFMSTATHEIRTPLTSIRGYSEIIQLQLELNSYEDISQHFEVIQKNIDRLQKLTDDLLDLQRIESGRIHLDQQKTSVNRLLSNVQEEIQPILLGKNQELKIINQTKVNEVTMDEMRIMQVIINYVSNAHKYSGENATIELRVSETQDGLEVSVKDEGIGLEEQDMKKLFTPFPDIEMEHVRRGTGLGLSICKGIIELHGGSVAVKSDGKGKGSTFSFVLPT